MIIVHTVVDGKAERVEMSAEDPVPEGTVWIDLLQPTEAEEKAIEHALKLDVPTAEETKRNEIIGYTYEVGGAIYMATQVTVKTDTDAPETTVVIFIHTEKCLITVRYEEMRSFSHFSKRLLRRPEQFNDGERVLVGLLGERVFRIADICANSLDALENLSRRIFRAQDITSCDATFTAQHYDAILRMLGRRADLIGKLHESLQSLFRALSYFEKKQEGELRYPAQLRRVKSELLALVEETVFLSNKVSFLLDATLGLISVQQNAIIKIFSVASVMLMPATLIASIYGMNFKHLPELEWLGGYPYALSMMVLSALVPYAYFKKRGWL